MHFLAWYPQLHYIRGRYSRRPAVNARSLHESTCFVDMLAETRSFSRWCLETRAVVRVRFQVPHRSMARFCSSLLSVSNERIRLSGSECFLVYRWLFRDDFSFLLSREKRKKKKKVVDLNCNFERFVFKREEFLAGVFIYFFIYFYELCIIQLRFRWRWIERFPSRDEEVCSRCFKKLVRVITLFELCSSLKMFESKKFNFFLRSFVSKLFGILFFSTIWNYIM